MERLDTKAKILDVAQELFAHKGYDGTSLRDIAHNADVNLSGIAYHFKNKETLYWNVFLNSHQWLESEIEKYVQQTEDICEIMLSIYQFLLDNSNFLRNSFMVMLSDSFPEIDSEIKTIFAKKKQLGPPGAAHLITALKKNLPVGVPDEKILWAVESMFANLVHWALLMSGKACNIIYEDHPLFTMEVRRQSIQWHCEAIVKSLHD